MARIAERWPLALASSSNREVIDRVMAVSGWDAVFRTWVSSEEVARGKPAPDVFLEALRRLGVRHPSDAAGVEDSHNGILAARAAGVRVDRRAQRRVPARPRGARGRRRRCSARWGELDAGRRALAG